MKKLLILLLATAILFAADWFSVKTHFCPRPACPYKGVVVDSAKEAIIEHTGCDEGTDCYIVEALHFEMPNATPAELEKAMWED